MANGGIQQILYKMGADLRLEEAKLTAEETTEYGAWKKLGMALGHFADIVEKNERDGYFTVGLLATCPSMPGLVAGLQHSGRNREPIKIGMLWLDAHPDFNTPETTRSGSLGRIPGGGGARPAPQGVRAGGRPAPRPAGHAAGCQARSAAGGSTRRHGRRAPDRSARAKPARRLDDRAAERRRSCGKPPGGWGRRGRDSPA